MSDSYEARLRLSTDDLAWRARAGYLGSWYCTDAQGHWPVGFAAVVVAATEDDARRLLDEKLAAAGLGPARVDGTPYTLTPLGLGVPHAIILVDGDY